MGERIEGCWTKNTRRMKIVSLREGGISEGDVV